MNDLDALLHELELTDRELVLAPMGDFAALEITLRNRATLIERTVSAIRQLHEPSSQHRDALIRTQEATSRALRQLILARHLLSTELSQLRVDQRLSDALRAQTAPAAHRLSVQG